MMTIDTIKKLFRTFALIVMSLAVQTARGAFVQPESLPTDSWANHRAQSFSSGSGTQADPWVITSPTELAFLAYQVTNNKSINGVACASAYYSLQADLDLNAHIWVPIGNLSTGNGNNFKGHFEGNGHVIRNMMLQWEVTNTTQAFGLFSTIHEKAVVKNLILDNAYIYNKATEKNPTADRLIAPFAGALKKNNTIQNIIVRNTKVEVKENYNQNGRWMIFGGFIAKMLDNNNSYNICNIYVDTDIDITKLTVNKTEAVYSSLFIPEFYSNIKDAPKNIYLEGSILASAKLTLVGPVFGTNLPSASTNKDTWQTNNANTYQYTTDGGTTKTDLTTKNAGGNTVTAFDASSFNTFSSENDLLSWTDEAGTPTLKKIVFPTLTKMRDESKRNNKDVVCTVSAEGIDGTISYEWVVDGKTQESNNTNTLTVTTTNMQRICSVRVTNTNGYDYTINFTVDPLYYSIDLYADNFDGGEGTADKPYIIKDDYQLAKLARDVNNGDKYSGIYFKLGADINLDEALWLPISQWDNSDSKFGGKFDGDGHTISNMHLQWEAASGKWVNWGLFGSIKGTADKIENYASVTNLIIENAVAEMKSSGTMTGQGLNVGIVSGEIYPYTEISNIILKGCSITDNEDVYSTTVGEHRIGGIVGNMEASSDFFRIFNITTDTEVSAFVNATTNGKPIYISSGIGKSNFKSYTDAVRIFPKNIYLHGTAVITKPSTTSNLNSGTLFGKTMNLTPTAAQMETWNYAFDNATLKNKYGNYLEFTDDKAKTFQELLNKYITDNSLNDKLLWAYDSENKYYFGNIELTGATETNYTVTAPEGTYDWYLSSDKVNWTKIEGGISAGTNSVEIPYQEYNQYVYAKSSTGVSKVLTVPALRIEAVTLNHVAGSKDYSVSIVNSIWKEDNSKLTITYNWYKNYDSSNNSNNILSTDSSYTHADTNPTKDQISCHIIVTYNGSEIANEWVGGSRIIYLCPAGVTIDGKNYAAGNDTNNDGLTPEHPKLTWQGAYAALSEEGSWDENKIVLMGTSNSDATFSTTAPYKGFAITDNLSADNVTGPYDTWKTAVEASKLNRNTTISGQHNGTDYKGVIEMRSNGQNGGLGIFGDTRFEHIAFKHIGGNYDILYCQYNNLEMGEGVVMKNYPNSPGYGTMDGSATMSFQIFGGLNNDNRFVPVSNKTVLQNMEKAMPHGREGFRITLKSGFYSCICAGGRQNDDNLNGIMGTPDMPVKCTIEMDIDREWNDKDNHNLLSTNTIVNYDAGIIMAGNHEGAMFGDVDIIIKSGYVGRVVNGTLGNVRNYKFTNNNKTYYFPNNTYMGRANILLDPASSRYSKEADTEEMVNARVVVTELYGGSCGRGFENNIIVDNPFYGISTVTIKGGTFKPIWPTNVSPENKAKTISGIFGAGAGGMTGLGNETHHTPDDRIPYWSGENLLYGDYSAAFANRAKYRCYNTDTHTFTDIDPYDTETSIVIEGGVFGAESDLTLFDGIYGGGSGYMATGLWTNTGAVPNKFGGNIYGSPGKTVSSLIINGGKFYCKNGIFAGGRGTEYYYEENSYGANGETVTIKNVSYNKPKASDYTALGQIYGNVEMTINGGNFHCPVFGGGYGVADAVCKDGTTGINTLSDMALITGQSRVNINGGTFYKNIYGGGDMARIENSINDATILSISDNANVLDSVFAGGNGRKKCDVYTDGETLHPELVGKVTGNTNVNFYGTPTLAPKVYGDIFGGGNLAVVDGNTNVNIFAASFAGEVYGGGKGFLSDQGDVINSANVTGNTSVVLAQDQGGQEEGENGKLEDQFSINVIWDRLWDGTKLVDWTDATKAQFYNYTDYKFLNPHNIYGGGKYACVVGTYTAEGTLTDGTGTATVSVRKGMTPFSLLKTDEWKQSYTDNKNPHFYVFGGGYGKHTKVGNTDVTVNVEGQYGIYNNEIDSNDEQLAKPRAWQPTGLSSVTEAQGEGSESSELSKVFDNSKGIPNFTILGVLGGGYAGTVSNDTKVTVDGNTFLHRVYGGGFGDPDASSADDKTGQVGGNTKVYVKGANIYGDVFGGGAGVASSKTADFVDVARVIGTTMVEVSDDARIYGNVYGGGDIANVGETAASPDYTSVPSSVTTLSQTDGSFIKHEASNFKAYVNILGGDIFGEVYAGGKGLTKDKAVDYSTLGRINGNTLLHIDNTESGLATIALDENDNNIPHIWSRIYGGCAYGTVDGNTLVHVEGGMLGNNIYGGGYGYLPLADDGLAYSEYLQVLGNRDTGKKATYANVLGNTKVQIDGGSWIWNRDADIDGNITVWDDANKKIVADEEGFKTLVLRLKTAMAKDKEEVRKVLDSLGISINPKFFDIDNLVFMKNHNIFGGGNQACYVGKYSESPSSDPLQKPLENTGQATVEINHSPLTYVTDMEDGKRQTYDMFDNTSLAGLCWYLSINEIEYPQFSVFGAGFGVNTKVGTTLVQAQPGAIISNNGDIIETGGKKYRYRAQAADMTERENFENDLYDDFTDPKKVSTEDKILYYGSVDGSGNDPKTYLRYRSSRLAWSLGVSGFTFKDIHGGGYSGYVCGSAKVETDNYLSCRNIFGGGLGAKPYLGSATAYSESETYDFGSVANTKVYIKSGIVSNDVFGGGAGITSKLVGDNYTDFPDMARVTGTTKVHLYGEYMTVNEKLLDRTVVFGSVYGGGDVANVGTTKGTSTVITADNLFTTDYTTDVNIRGGAIYSQIFAGGSGRLNSQCADYKKLGGVYGNARITIDYPHSDMSYPYTSKDPNDYLNIHSDATSENTHASANILNRIYGGCENGTVYGNTVVDIEHGNLGYNIFGGGWGKIVEDEDLSADKRVTSADVTGNAHIFVNGGNALMTSYWLPDERTWVPASVKGTKIYSPQYDHEARKFKINHNIYGGGNLASTVNGNTYITMTHGFLKSSTQMVGNDNTNFFETNEWKEIYHKVGSPHFAIFGGGYGENTVIKGNTNVNMSMEGYLSGDPAQIITPGEEYKHFVSEYSVMDVVGGGYSGKIEGDTHVKANGLFCRRIFGGGFYNSVRNTNIDITSVDSRDIFGGGLMGDVLKSTTINVGSQGASNNNKDIYIHGSIYGANDVSGYVNIGLNETTKEFVDLGGSGTNINISGGNIDGNIYGAGNGDYLYALDRKGNTKVTVNEHYRINPDDPSSEEFDLVYTVPMRETMPSYKSASDPAKIVNINSWRPLTNKVNIKIAGQSVDDKITIKGDIYGGGNSASVLRVNPSSSATTEMEGSVRIDIGSHVEIGRVFMGCNGDALFTASEDNAFMANFRKLNGDITRPDGDLDLGQTIDWLNDPSNKAISTLYLPTKNDERPLVYPHLLDLYFQPVEMDIQAKLLWNGSEDGTDLTNCTIGTFCCGGNRGNMNIYPATDGKKKGNVFEYTFPEGLTITDKIVGGCNNANYEWKSGDKRVRHEGGYLLGLAKSNYPFIKLNIKNKFRPAEEDGAYVGGNVYGGCYETGTVRGDITVNLLSDMLEGKSKTHLDKSNELIMSNPKYSALNVYGAGYGMESYVYGNPHVVVAEDFACETPTMTDDKFNHSGVSANFVYGGGQQGNVIGVTNVEVFNGHIYKSVTGGSYSGYVWGSTHVKVGYPKYYEVKFGKTGRYILNRIDQDNVTIDDEFNKLTDKGIYAGMTAKSQTVKQSIYLVTGDLVTQGVYNDICSIKNGDVETKIEDSDKADYFTEVPAKTPEIGWDNVNIKIGEAVYGGGYSLAHGASVMANNTTVLKFTDEYNLDNAFTTNEEHKAELASLPGGTTKGFGGNTTILVADLTEGSDRDHISISHQEMKQVTDIAKGTDLQGYYYKETGGNYRYIYMAGKYYASSDKKVSGKEMPDNIEDNKYIYEYDNEGGIFGDGHLSYAEGFRSADLTGYGFAGSSVNSPKILNTFQRLDILRLTDNCFTLLGARDYATNSTDKTPYSVSRIGEIQMVADKIQLTPKNGLYYRADNGMDTKRARNYMGFANNIRYVGAINSNVAFDSQFYNGNGALVTEKTYKSYKQDIIDNYVKSGNNKEFEQRNNGSAKNMIGIASGYALKVQNVQELTKVATGEIVDRTYYGPIYGVVEMNLIDVHEDEGGGYVYADNIHKRAAGDTHAEDFLETTGNFVFPILPQEERFIVDDCFPVGYYDKHSDSPTTTAGAKSQTLSQTQEGEVAEQTTSTVPDVLKDDIHYWYVTGYNYYYNAHITGYTSKNPQKFYSKNDEIMVLTGMKPGQSVKVVGIKNHFDYSSDDSYSSDLSDRNYSQEDKFDCKKQKMNGKYKLFVCAPDSALLKKDGEGFLASLPMNADTSKIKYTAKQLPTKNTSSYPKILFMLSDEVDNSTKKYYDDHLAKAYKTTVILADTAMKYKTVDGTLQNELEPVIDKLKLDGRLYTKKQDGTYEQVTDEDISIDNNHTYYYRTGDFDIYQKVSSFYTKTEGTNPTYNKATGTTSFSNLYGDVMRFYTYTIDLTIEYVQGPEIGGRITIVNCALPGEVIRLKKDKIEINADESFAANGYYWRIGKDLDGSEPWDVDGSAPEYDVYKVGDEKGKGLFSGCYYNKTEDYLEIPAYYFMNGYKVQLGVSMNGLEDIFSAPLHDCLVIHNYHQMDPHVAGVNLHLPEALARANKEAGFAEPRIYLSDQQDIRAFQQFIDTVGSNMTKVKIGSDYADVPRYGEKAQFVLQKDITLPDDYKAPTTFKGIIHGNGHVISGLSKSAAFISDNQGQIYNLGLASGKIAASNTDGAGYHCCFEYKTAEGGPYVYRLDGYRYDGYSYDDFRYGKVAYDLNQYYLEARNKLADNNNLQYVKDYYANGDYQYAYRKDAITGNSTGIQYLRTGQGAAIYPNYGNYETRHDKTHAIDCPRAHGYTAAHKATQAEVDAKKAAVGEMVPESRTGNYEPLFNAAKHSEAVTNTELMNDYIFWGQDLQSLPDAYPSQIASSQVSDMTNRVYRAAAYYRDTNLSTFHYNAFKRDVTMMHSYVHIPSTTAIDFTCQNDKAEAVGLKDGIYYAPVKDIATDYSSLIITKDLSRNLLVYTPTDNAESITDIYDASRHLLYNENSKESEIQAHLVTIDNSNQASTQYLHLVERADVADHNNDFCAPIAFTVTDRTWYTRQPKAYAEASNSAWEGICLPFTVKKAEASVNGEITHFYGTAPENTSPADNHWNLHHEYWLRGMTAVNGTKAKFQRPGERLFTGGGTTGVSYTFDNSFFVDTYGKNNYNSADNAYYSTSHTWDDYLPLTQSVPYIMSLPGKSYYEFDLTSEFYNRTNPSQPAQTVTFSADGSVYIPVTVDMKTSLEGYAHTGTFIAKETAQGSIYGINATGTAFEDAAATILPFRTYIEKTATPSPGAKPYSPYVSVINIAETRGMDVITPEGGGQADVQPDGNYILIAPAGRGRISVESTFDTTIKVFTPSGQLYRILDVRQGSATYSGFQSGLYIVGKVKVRVM